FTVLAFRKALLSLSTRLRAHLADFLSVHGRRQDRFGTERRTSHREPASEQSEPARIQFEVACPIGSRLRIARALHRTRSGSPARTDRRTGRGRALTSFDVTGITCSLSGSSYRTSFMVPSSPTCRRHNRDYDHDVFQLFRIEGNHHWRRVVDDGG